MEGFEYRNPYAAPTAQVVGRRLLACLIDPGINRRMARNYESSDSSGDGRGRTVVLAIVKGEGDARHGREPLCAPVEHQ